MAGRAFISRFSPNRTALKTLENIFVQRHQLAEVWLERLRDSVLTEAKHHLLAIGPRGCGKSHLVALLVGRLRKQPDVAERVRIAWLPEDETTPSFWKFLLRILRALNAEYGDEFPAPPRENLAGAADDRRSAALTRYLLEKLGERTLLVVVENLDDVMRGLNHEGQKRWRAFLQEHPVAATLATAQQLTEDISSRERPFFNFFQIEHLGTLSADEALSLLRKIAEHTDNLPLVAFLESPSGRARVRAIRHIAGGSHRVFIILSEFATQENLDGLVAAFEELLDELTPYYQERLRWLPDQQREIVEFLCRQNRTARVKQIAVELYLSEQTAAAQLKSLRDKGYVTSESVGRESRYELAEPLMRLCVEVKDPQREPIRLIVEFLRVWYDQAGLQARLECLPPGADLERRYVYAALQAHRAKVPSPVEAALNDDLAAARGTGDPEELVRVLVEFAATTDNSPRCIAVASELADLGRHVEALAACDRALHFEPNNDAGWYNKAWSLVELERYAEALACLDRAIELKPDDAPAWSNKGWVLAQLGRNVEALACYDQAIELKPDYVLGWNNKGWALGQLGRNVEALACYDRAIELKPDYARALNNKARVLNEMGHYTEALAVCERLKQLDATDARAWSRRGVTRVGAGQIDAAVEDFRHAIKLNGHYAEAFEALAEAHFLQGDWDKAERVLSERFLLPPSQSKSGHLPDLIATIFRTSSDASVWAFRAGRLAGIARTAQAEWEQRKSEKGKEHSSANNSGTPAPPNPLAMLGDSLVRSLRKKAYTESSADALDAWANVWRKVAEQYTDLSLAARLFGVGVRYLQTNDERVLFDLVQEERSILRSLFGLSDGSDE